jgi:predicted ester cyclase
MTGTDLLAVYRDYLTCLNGRRWDDLGRFVADELTYNGGHMTLGDYRALLQGDTHAIPDLQFRPELLLADDAIVSCRLFFECTPQHAFLGFEPTGERMSFAEHVFYRFVGGRITDVWSLIDRDAIREQIHRGT